MSDNIDPTPSSDSSTTSVLEQLVGPGKKFADHEALAKGKAESDAFIQKLLSENKDLKGIVTAQDSRLARMEARVSILDRLGDRSNDGEETPPTPPTTGSAAEPTVAGLSEADTLRLIEQHDIAKQRKANSDYVDRVVSKALGTDAVAFMRQRASELGVAPELLQQMAATSPKALLAMIGINPEGKTQSNSMYVKSGNGSQPTGGAPQIRNQSFYNKLKNEMGATKFALDSKLQVQMHRDMQTMGDAFDS